MKVQELFERQLAVTCQTFAQSLVHEFGKDGMKIKTQKKPETSPRHKAHGAYYQIGLEMLDASSSQIAEIGDYIKKAGFTKTYAATDHTSTSFSPPKGSMARVCAVDVMPHKGDLYIWIKGYENEIKFDYKGGQDDLKD